MSKKKIKNYNYNSSNKRSVQNTIIKIIFVLAGIMLVTPLAPLVTDILPSQYLGVFLIQGITVAMLAGWVILMTIDSKYRPDIKNPLVMGGAILLLLIFLSWIFSVDPTYSFWSSPGRMTGLINYLYYFAWFFVLVSILKNSADFHRLMTFNSVIAVAVFLVGVKFWTEEITESVQSTLGNQLFFGSYMMISALIGLYLVFSASSRKSYWLGWLACLSGTIAVFISGSRGAVLTLLFSYFIAGILIFIYSNINRKKKIIIAISLTSFVVLSVGSIILARYSPLKNEIKYRLPAPIQRLVYKDFGYDRWVLWNYAIKGALEKPIFGYGFGLYEVSFYKYYDPTSTDIEILNERFADRAHNQYLDYLISSGVVGLIGFLLFIISALWCAWRSITDSQNDKNKRANIWLATTIIAYATFSLFMFDTSATLIISLLCFSAVAVVWRNRNSDYSEDELKESSIGQNKISLIKIVLVCTLSLLIFGLTTYLPAVKYTQVTEAKQMVDVSRSKALEMFEKGLSGYNPMQHDLSIEAMESLIKWSENISLVSPQMEKLLVLIGSKIEEAATDRSYNYRIVLAASAVNRMLGDYDLGYLEKAEQYANQAQELSPERFGSYFEKFEIGLLRGDADFAIDNLIKAIERIPRKNTANQSYLYYRLASAYTLNCDSEKSKNSFEKAVKQRFDASKDNRLAIDISMNCSMDPAYAWAEEYIDSVIVTYPDHPDLLEAAAKIYYSANSLNKVSAMINRLNNRDPQRAKQLADLFEVVGE